MIAYYCVTIHLKTYIMNQHETITMTLKQEKYVNDTTDWLIAVYERQGKWFADNDLYSAFPLKSAITREGFLFILSQVKLALNSLNVYN